MKNVSMIINNIMNEIKVTALLDSEGIRWTKRGMKISAIGVTDEIFGILYEKADKIWTW